jgi:glycine hydroxymethyltransferase
MIMFKADLEKQVNKTIFPGIQGGPLMHVIAAKAVAFLEDLQPEYKTYCEQIVKNSRKLADTLAKKGFRIVTGGTDTHLFLVDLTANGITGKDAEDALGRAGMTVNKNTIPKETRSPFVTSGIRLGTPALTTKGMKEGEMEKIGGWIADVLKDVTNEGRQTEIKGEIRKLCEKFPVYR